jgi:hypothetical protein
MPENKAPNTTRDGRIVKILARCGDLRVPTEHVAGGYHGLSALRDRLLVRCTPAKSAGTHRCAAPSARGVSKRSLNAPCASPDGRSAGKKFKDGRHVGLDFFELLIEVAVSKATRHEPSSSLQQYPAGSLPIQL